MGIDRAAMKRLAEASWDVSVLGLTGGEFQDMDDDERTERLAEELNRAADLLQAIETAFAKELGTSRPAVAAHAAGLIKLARKIRPIK